MADLENVRVTRASKKRVVDIGIDNTVVQPMIKKRVVLGELTNLSNVVVNPSLGNEPQKSKAAATAKCKTKKDLLDKKAESTLDKKTGDDVRKVDVDGDLKDPQMCVTYATDIYDYLHKMEIEPKRRPLPDYIEKIQKDVTPNMRGILVDWLVEVADEYRLVSDTLFLAITYVDRFLSLTAITRQKLQLLGVTSILIASKYEEISPPSIEELCYITDNTYTKDEVLCMETDLLNSLKFELGNPTIKTFLQRFTRIAQKDHNPQDMQLECLGFYIAELSLLDYNCVKFLPSLVAGSVIFIARFIMRPDEHPWNLNLQKCSGYKPAELKECVLIIHDLYQNRRGSGLQSIKEKYNQHKFKCVATIPSLEIPISFFEDVKQ